MREALPQHSVINSDQFYFKARSDIYIYIDSQNVKEMYGRTAPRRADHHA